MTDAVQFYNHEFWHADTTGMLIWNAKLRGGWVLSTSLSSRLDPGMAAGTPYSLMHRDQEKEQAWEDIRLAEFPHCPSRMKALFLFLTKEDADHAVEHWWKGNVKALVPVLVPQGTSVHVADFRLLDTSRSRWEVDARRYWSGETTEDPRPEAVVHGMVFIPNVDQYNVLPWR